MYQVYNIYVPGIVYLVSNVLQNSETWVLDVRFTKPHNEEESFASKIDKY